MNDIEKEAIKYDLDSLINLQEKRKNNILLFEKSIDSEKEASFQEEVASSSLETKIRLHNFGISKLDDTEYNWILSDLPKIKSTIQKRMSTILLLRQAIIEEQASIKREACMIEYLEKNGNKK
jgi:hypothetical protein